MEMQSELPLSVHNFVGNEFQNLKKILSGNQGYSCSLKADMRFLFLVRVPSYYS